MTLDFRNPGDLQVIMVDYIKGVLEDLPEVRMGRSTILADNNMFQVRPEDYQALINKERKHHYTTRWHGFYFSYQGPGNISKCPLIYYVPG